MNSIEPRRLIKSGNSSFVVSLPLPWLKENNLGKGDLVYITKNGNNEIILLPSQNNNRAEKERVITMDVDGKNFESIRREISSAYINSYDIIKVKGKTLKSKIKHVKRVSDLLIGMSLFGQVDGELIIRDLFSHDKLPPGEIVSRINITLESMFSLLKNSLKDRNFRAGYNEIRELDIEVNRNYFLIWKLTKRKTTRSIEEIDANHFWWLAMNQENIGDELKRIAKTLMRINFSEAEYQKLYNIIEASESYYSRAISALNLGDREEALKLAETPLVKICEEILGNNNNLLFESLCDRIKTISRHIYHILKITIF